jgi:pimeloyl-ACP methyl ester carboxylesterase
MATTVAQTGYAQVNGLNLYYEIYGTGQPLVMLHGGLGVIEMFEPIIPSLGADKVSEPIIPALAQTRQVIAVELQAHGHTADIERPLSFELMADDIVALLEQLGIKQADILGYSLGGGVALQTAIRHPAVVRKLMLVSTTFKRDGWYPESLAGMAAMNAEAAESFVGSPMHQAYINVAPRPEDWPTLVAKLGQMLGQDYDWSTGVAAIKAPTLLVFGDADSVRPQHILEFFGLLGGGKVDGMMVGVSNSQLAVLPGTTHITILFRTDLFLPIVTSFLDAPMPEAR